MNFRFKKQCSSILAILFFSCSLVCGLEYEAPNKIEVSVIPSVILNSTKGNFTYNYSVVSSNKSIQEINNFRVLTDNFYRDVNSPEGWDIFKSTPPNLPKMVDWGAIGGVDDYIPPHSNVDPSPFNIRPGHSLSGFSFESASLPGIATFYSEGFVKIPEVAEEPPENDPLPPYEYGDDAFKGKTIGPVAVADTSSGGLIDRLIVLKDSMPSYGWITSQGIINSLNVKLRAAKESISKGNNKTAQNQLNAFINELDAQKGKQVNENAWALLKANAEYLISKLGA